MYTCCTKRWRRTLIMRNYQYHLTPTTTTYYFVFTNSDKTCDTFCRDSNLPHDIVHDLFLAFVFLQGRDASTTTSRTYSSQEDYENTEIQILQRPLQQPIRLSDVIIQPQENHNA